MKYVGSCVKGFEDICSKEVDGKKLFKGRVEFDKIKNFRTVSNIYELIKKFKFKGFEDLINKINVKGKFFIKCNREGKHKFNSMKIKQELNKKLNVDFRSKKILFVDIVDNNCLIGWLKKDNLCKRDYRVKLTAESLNACLAASMCYLLGKGKIFNPFCKDGVFLIEASLLGNKGYGFCRNLRAARINSKIAKIDLNLFEDKLEWIGTRFKENEVKIISYFPCFSKRKAKNFVNKLYKEFFHHARFVAKKMCILCRTDDLLKFSEGFKVKKREVWQGKEKLYVFLFEKNI